MHDESRDLHSNEHQFAQVRSKAQGTRARTLPHTHTRPVTASTARGRSWWRSIADEQQGTAGNGHEQLWELARPRRMTRGLHLAADLALRRVGRAQYGDHESGDQPQDAGDARDATAHRRVPRVLGHSLGHGVEFRVMYAMSPLHCAQVPLRCRNIEQISCFLA
jgi:hypothetical protein